MKFKEVLLEDMFLRILEPQFSVDSVPYLACIARVFDSALTCLAAGFEYIKAKSQTSDSWRSTSAPRRQLSAKPRVDLPGAGVEPTRGAWKAQAITVKRTREAGSLYGLAWAFQAQLVGPAKPGI
jgi:hypothetical protein